jgi:hypothetical protein
MEFKDHLFIRRILLVTGGLVVGGGAARVVATGTGRGAGGARIPELPPPVFPLPNGLKKAKFS